MRTEAQVKISKRVVDWAQFITKNIHVNLAFLDDFRVFIIAVAFKEWTDGSRTFCSSSLFVVVILVAHAAVTRPECLTSFKLTKALF